MLNFMKRHLGLNFASLFCLFIGTGLMAFAMVNVHLQAQITEGGMLGLSLLLAHFTGISPAYVSLFCDLLLYLLAFSLLGKAFIKKALFSALLYVLMFRLFSFCGPLLPSLVDLPWLAAIIGGLMIGLGVSCVVLLGFVTSGDDTLVLLLNRKFKLSIACSYMLLDLLVLALSLSYLSYTNIIWSLLTTLISSFVVGRLEAAAWVTALKKYFLRKQDATLQYTAQVNLD